MFIIILELIQIIWITPKTTDYELLKRIPLSLKYKNILEVDNISKLFLLDIQTEYNAPVIRRTSSTAPFCSLISQIKQCLTFLLPVQMTFHQTEQVTRSRVNITLHSIPSGNMRGTLRNPNLFSKIAEECQSNANTLLRINAICNGVFFIRNEIAKGLLMFTHSM
jgi:hypothetical protein